jgi:hypothetical protein
MRVMQDLQEDVLHRQGTHLTRNETLDEHISAPVLDYREKSMLRMGGNA